MAEDFAEFGTRLDFSGSGQRLDAPDFSGGGVKLDFAGAGTALEPQRGAPLHEQLFAGIDEYLANRQIMTAVRGIERAGTLASMRRGDTGLEALRAGLGRWQIRLHRERGEEQEAAALEARLAEAEAALQDPERLARFDAARQQIADTIQGAIERQKELRGRASTVKLSPESERMLEAQTFKEAFGAFKDDPIRIVAEIGARSLPHMAEAIPSAIGGGLMLGPVGAAIGMGAGSALAEYRGAFVEALQEAGVDLEDAKSLLDAAENDELMERAHRYAATRAGIIGAFDAASMGVASRTLAPFKQPVAREVTNLVAQTGVQAGFGGAGEAAAQAATGKWAPGEIVGEMVGEGITAPLDVGAAVAAGIRDTRAQAREDRPQPQQPPSRGLIRDGEQIAPAAEVDATAPPSRRPVSVITADGELIVGEDMGRDVDGNQLVVDRDGQMHAFGADAKISFEDPILTPSDVASPIPSDLIAEGKRTLDAAMRGEEPAPTPETPAVPESASPQPAPTPPAAAAEPTPAPAPAPTPAAPEPVEADPIEAIRTAASELGESLSDSDVQTIATMMREQGLDAESAVELYGERRAIQEQPTALEPPEAPVEEPEAQQPTALDEEPASPPTRRVSDAQQERAIELQQRAIEAGDRGSAASLAEIAAGRDPTGGLIDVDRQLDTLEAGIPAASAAEPEAPAIEAPTEPTADVRTEERQPTEPTPNEAAFNVWELELTPEGRRRLLTHAGLSPDRHKVLWRYLKADEKAAIQRALPTFNPDGATENAAAVEPPDSTAPQTASTAPPEAEPSVTSPGVAEPPLRIEDYSDKSIIIRGQTKENIDRIKAATSVRPLWNRKAKGWVFPKKREAEVRAALADLLAPVDAPATEQAPEPSPTAQPGPYAKWRDASPAQRREMLREAGYTDNDQARVLSGIDWNQLTDPVRRALSAVQPARQERPQRGGWRPIGANASGNPLFEDERGVRSYTEGGARITEKVRIIPGRGISIDKDSRGDEFLTAEERAASQAEAQSRDEASRTSATRQTTDLIGKVEKADFDRRLVELSRAGVLALSRSDLAANAPVEVVRASEVDMGYGSVAHSVRTDRPIPDTATPEQRAFAERVLAAARELIAESKKLVDHDTGRVGEKVMLSKVLERMNGGTQAAAPAQPEAEAPAQPEAEAPAQPAEAPDASIEDQIRDAYRRLTAGTWNEEVRIADLKAALPSADRAAVDDALLEMMRSGRAHLLPIDDPARLTAADREAEVAILDNPRHLVFLEAPEDGVQSRVPDRDAGASTADVQPAAPERGSERPRPEEVRGSAPDVRGTDEGRAEAPERVSKGAARKRGGKARAGDADRVPDERAGTERPVRAADSVKGENYTIEPGALAEERGRMQKARDNIRAIELMRQIEAEGRPATREEQVALAKYVGWGGIKDIFPDADGKFGKGLEKLGERLKELLPDTEYATARRSQQYAHYTSETVVRAMWDAARQLGFEGGNVFEPGMGTGNFAGMMPADVAASTQYHGLELDHATARIARLLYPKWGVRQDDFTRAPLPTDTYDLVIGNPPFADIPIKSDAKYPQGFFIHDYFFVKSLDAVRPGGLLMFISSAGTMNKLDAKAREYMADRADLVGAIRLPGNAFERNAGTKVTTDIIILRKRLPGETAGDRTWTETVNVTLPNKHGTPTKGAVSRYFFDHPEMVLGEEGFFDPLHEGRYAVRAPKGFDLDGAIRGAIARLPHNVMSDWTADFAERAEIDFGTAELKDGSFYLSADGRLMQRVDGVGRPVERRGKGVEGGKSAAEIERIKGLIPIRDALRAVFAADLAQDTKNAERARKRLNEAYDAFVEKFGPINLANFQYRRPTVIQQESARAEAREEARYAGLPWDEGDFDPTDMIARGAKLAEIARARKEAREAAEKAGKPFNEGSFDPSDMPDIVIEKRPNIDPFMDDPESYRLRAIEKYNDATGEAAKSAVFFENVITREVEPQINGVGDALLWTLNQRGHFDLGEVARLANVSEAQALEELGERIFRVPGTDSQWVTREEYLSGNVRRKLRVARAAAARDPSLQRNVDALEAVQPAPIPPSDINAQLGMPWLPTEIIEQFGREALGLEHLSVTYTPLIALWTAKGDTRSVASTTTWGTEAVRAPELLANALNRQDPRVYREVTNPDGSKGREVDPVATQAAQEKMAAIKERFAEWLWSDEARANQLADLYNEEYNNLVVREYDGAYLTTPGISASWSWRPHQKRVIARIIQDGNTYMAHAVGAGKTSAMIGAGMEMRRLGLVRKPMYVVPNHMLGQFTKEFYEQYPTAKIAVADERRFHTDRRKQFIANVATDDLDAVIITHSAFGMIPISNDFQDGLIQEQIAQYRQVLQALDKSNETRITRSRLEKQIEQFEQRLSGRGTKKTDQVFTFEEMGVDFLFVDEAHMFRKLDFATKMSGLKGISPKGSKASWDLYVKTRYLETVNPGRNLVMASGTPVTNTMAELYTVSRFLQPRELEERGLTHFDAWAGAYGDKVTELEPDPSGNYKNVTRFARFVNVAELSNMVRQIMDVVTSKQLEQYVTRPQLKGGKRIMNLAERSDVLEEYQQHLKQRMDAIAARRGPPKKGDDIMLSVINDGRHAAIDMRLVDPNLPNDPGSKLNLLVDNVYRIWKETKKQPFHRVKAEGGYEGKPFDHGPAAQMIFANLGLSGTRGFAVPEYIRSELVRRGVPKNQIAFIRDYGTHVAKQRLFNDINEGKVRVLIGSTAKMATGVNAQRRLYALHNLDPLWYPADDEQRNGRILRQGNMNPEVEIHDYSTKGTYDSTMWGLMEKKARFIQGFFEGDPSLRDMEDLGEASVYEQAKAITTADPRLIRLTDLRQQLEKARRRKSAHDREQASIRSKLADARHSVDYYSKRVPQIEADIARRQDTDGDKFRAKLGRKSFDDRAEFGAALIGEAESRVERAGKRELKDEKIGELGGFDIVLSSYWTGKSTEWRVSIMREGGMAHDVSYNNSARGLVQSLENVLRGFEDNLALARKRLASAEKAILDLESQQGRAFKGQEELDRLAREVRELEKELEAEAENAAPPPPMRTPDEDAPDFELAAPIDSPAFRRWFGDSKVVDAQGRPLVVYHGTGADVTAFRTPAFFTTSPESASAYAEDRGVQGTPNVVPVYLKIERMADAETVEQIGEELAGDPSAIIQNDADAARVIAELQRRGYDGATFVDQDAATGDLIDAYIVFSPEQVKSAIGNRGTFDPDSSRIDLEARGGRTIFQRARAVPRFTPEWDAKRAAVAKRLRAELDRMGLSKISVRVPDIIAIIDKETLDRLGTATGQFDRGRGLIDVALASPNYSGTLRHEVIHALKSLGLFRAAEWRALERAAEADEALMAEARKRYKGRSDEKIREEAIAIMFGAWERGEQGARGFIRTAFERIRDFFDALRNALQGNGFYTADSIFRAIDRGDIGRRQRIRDASGRFASDFELSDQERVAGEAADRMKADDAGLIPPDIRAKVRGEGRRFIEDMGLFTKFAVYPRTIASVSPSFTPVYLVANQQYQRRDVIISELSEMVAPYMELKNGSKDRVNAVLEIGRLAGREFPVESGKGLRVVNDQRDTDLSKKGQTIRLSPEEAAAYRGVRRAMNHALDLFREQVTREFGLDPAKVKNAADVTAMIEPTMRPGQIARLEAAAAIIGEIENARRTGYVPFSRWGNVVVSVRRKVPDGEVDPLTGEKVLWETLYSRTFEIDGARGLAQRMMAKGKLGQIPEVRAELERLKKQYGADPDAEISVFQVSKGSPIQPGMSMSDIDMLAEVAKIDTAQWEQVREGLEAAFQARGFRKHFFGSKNTPGYSPDFERSIADYIQGIGGYLARRQYASRMEAAIADIPETKTREREYAMAYRDYINSPREEFAAMRQAGFLYFIAGNISTAALNLTQVPLFTMPYLTMFSSPARIAKEFARAYKDAAAMFTKRAGLDLFTPEKAPADVRAALREAWDRGEFVPLVTFEMMGKAHNRSVLLRGLSQKARTAVDTVALTYSFAERVNRVATFIAAYRLAASDPSVMAQARKALGSSALAKATVLDEATPAAFANWVVDETHFRLGKVNRPTMMRGAGAALLQFKSFVLNALELQYRMATMHGRQGRVAFGLILAGLFMTAGMWGLPFAEDVGDLWEALYKWWTGIDIDTRAEVREIMTELTGSPKIAEAFSRGSLRALGVDMSRRVGMGELVPRTTEEAAGVPMSLTVGKVTQAATLMKDDRYFEAFATMLPNFMKNPLDAYAWTQQGVRTGQGGAVIPPEDITATDAGLKAIGFTPARIANFREYEYSRQRAERAVDDLRRSFYSRLARSIAEDAKAQDAGDMARALKAQKRIEEIMEELNAHNEKARPHEIIQIDRRTLRDRIAAEYTGRDEARRARSTARGRVGELQEAFGVSN